jgi:WD40 repeat protein
MQVMGMGKVSVGGPAQGTILPSETLSAHHGAVDALAWNNNDLLASGDDDGQIVVWKQRDDGQALEESANWAKLAEQAHADSQWEAADIIDHHKDGGITGLTWSPDSDHLCVVRGT